MSVNSVLGLYNTGMQAGIMGIRNNATNLASKDAMQANVSPVNDIVVMKANLYQVQALGKVVETTDKMMGTLIDEFV